jgi:hypothetical protein
METMKSSVAAVASSSSSKCSTGTGITGGGGVLNSMSGETMEQSITPAATVYPNPTKDFVTIQLKDASLSSKNVRIVDAYGRVNQSDARIVSDRSIQVDLSRLSSGVYFIWVMVDNEYKIYKVVKM